MNAQTTDTAGTTATAPQSVISLLWQSIRKDDIPVRSATLAYYALFAFVPLLLLLFIVGDVLLDIPRIQSTVMNFITERTGPEIEPLLQRIISRSFSLTANIAVGIIAVLFILFSAVNFFVHLRRNFAHIFTLKLPGTSDRPPSLVAVYLRSFLYMLLILVPAILAIATHALVSFLLPVITPVFETLFPTLAARLLIGGVTTIPSLFLFFTVLYRLVSAGTIPWKGAFVGSIVASMLLLMLNVMLELYIAFGATVSLYGAAGFLIIFLLWLYYSMHAVFIGAEAAKIYAGRLEV